MTCWCFYLLVFSCDFKFIIIIIFIIFVSRSVTSPTHQTPTPARRLSTRKPLRSPQTVQRRAFTSKHQWLPLSLRSRRRSRRRTPPQPHSRTWKLSATSSSLLGPTSTTFLSSSRLSPLPRLLSTSSNPFSLSSPSSPFSFLTYLPPRPSSVLLLLTTTLSKIPNSSSGLGSGPNSTNSWGLLLTSCFAHGLMKVSRSYFLCFFKKTLDLLVLIENLKWMHWQIGLIWLCEFVSVWSIGGGVRYSNGVCKAGQ